MSRTEPNPSPEVIQYVGVSDLSADEQTTVNTLSTEYYGKIKRELKDLANMTVHVKCYQKEGNRKKYSMHVKAWSPTHNFDSSNNDDWELAAALHMAFNSILHQIQHKLHTDRTRPDSV